jgi:hypothetical protein
VRIHSVVTPVIAGGVASVSTPGFSGKLLTIVVKFSGAPSGTVTATAKHSMVGGAVDEAILTTVAATNRAYQPRKLGQTVAAADITGQTAMYTLNGSILFAIAGGPNGQTVAIDVHVEE